MKLVPHMTKLRNIEADHNAQPEIANLIIKMLQELQKMITTNNELKRELNKYYTDA